MPLPRAVPVTLTAAQRTTLKNRARGAKTAYRDLLRALIVLATARGRDNARIAADLQITADTVRKWRGRFAGLQAFHLRDTARWHTIRWRHRPVGGRNVRPGRLEDLRARNDAGIPGPA